jgi:hypothetical protein
MLGALLLAVAVAADPPAWATTAVFPGVAPFPPSEGQGHVELSGWANPTWGPTFGEAFLEPRVSVGAPARTLVELSGELVAVPGLVVPRATPNAVSLAIRWAPAEWRHLVLNPTVGVEVELTSGITQVNLGAGPIVGVSTPLLSERWHLAADAGLLANSSPGNGDAILGDRWGVHVLLHSSFELTSLVSVGVTARHRAAGPLAGTTPSSSLFSTAYAHSELTAWAQLVLGSVAVFAGVGALNSLWPPHPGDDNEFTIAIVRLGLSFRWPP